MAALGTIGADQWFEHLFGFKEHEALRQRMADGQVVRNPALIREKLELRGARSWPTDEGWPLTAA